jgi:hypothetical protein
MACWYACFGYELERIRTCCWRCQWRRWSSRFDSVPRPALPRPSPPLLVRVGSRAPGSARAHAHEVPTDIYPVDRRARARTCVCVCVCVRVCVCVGKAWSAACTPWFVRRSCSRTRHRRPQSRRQNVDRAPVQCPGRSGSRCAGALRPID